MKLLRIILSCTAFSLTSLGVTAQGSNMYAGTVSNCVARWTFDNNASLVIDSSGNNNNGILSNVVTTYGWRNLPGQGAKFNGSTSRGIVPNSSSLQISGDMSIVALVKFNGFYSGYCQGNEIVTKGVGDRAPGVYLMRTSDNKYDQSCAVASPTKNIMESGFGPENSTPIVVNQPYIDTGKWYFFAGTFKDGVARKLYQVEMDTANFTPPTAPMTIVNTQGYSLGVNNDDVSLGYCGPGTPYWFNGVMDEVVIFDKCLELKDLVSVYTYLWNKVPVPTDTSSNPNNIGDLILKKEIGYFVKDHNLYLSGNSNEQYYVAVTDMMGRTITQSVMKDGSITIDLSQYAQQMFVVNIYNKKGRYAFKVTN